MLPSRGCQLVHPCNKATRHLKPNVAFLTSHLSFIANPRGHSHLQFR
jgi:hypothetical protein